MTCSHRYSPSVPSSFRRRKRGQLRIYNKSIKAPPDLLHEGSRMQIAWALSHKKKARGTACDIVSAWQVAQESQQPLPPTLIGGARRTANSLCTRTFPAPLPDSRPISTVLAKSCVLTRPGPCSARRFQHPFTVPGIVVTAQSHGFNQRLKPEKRPEDNSSSLTTISVSPPQFAIFAG